MENKKEWICEYIGNDKFRVYRGKLWSCRHD